MTWGWSQLASSQRTSPRLGIEPDLPRDGRRYFTNEEVTNALGEDRWESIRSNIRRSKNSPELVQSQKLSRGGSGTGIPNLRVNQQELIAFNGEKVTINCYYHNPGEIKWCRLGHSCVVGSSGLIDGARVTIDTRVSNVFTVTMSGLAMEDSGWYWCAKGDLQMPVHVMVTEKPTTNTPKTTLSAIPDAEDLQSDIISFVIPLCLLVVAVMTTLLIWFLFKRQKQPKVGLSDTTKRSSAEMESYTGVVYAKVTTAKPPTLPGVEIKPEDVTYSTLA
ncbi:CMRF35-like molecule 1 [Brachionichthys hirsutus]|uniref:CMRF35-like molecule 1 n=1 Tax=Brachionichthys hirsutus TaxID=412623 RepID=UPI0036052DC4